MKKKDEAEARDSKTQEAETRGVKKNTNKPKQSNEQLEEKQNRLQRTRTIHNYPDPRPGWSISVDLLLTSLLTG